MRQARRCPLCGTMLALAFIAPGGVRVYQCGARGVRYEVIGPSGVRHKMMTIDHSDALFATGGRFGLGLVPVRAVRGSRADMRVSAGVRSCRGCSAASSTFSDHNCMDAWYVEAVKQERRVKAA